MLSRGAQRGASLLWGKLAAPAQQIRCVGNATKLFPDGSGVQGDAYPSERDEYGQVSGMPTEMTGRTVILPDSSCKLHSSRTSRRCAVQACARLLDHLRRCAVKAALLPPHGSASAAA